jgi:ADP-ribose pyrophosphatase YjhB (NUDIX family)
MHVSLGVSVVIRKNHSVLLVMHADLPVWCLPGGRVEPGESVDQAALREVREETGLEVRLERLVGVYFRPMGPIGNHQVLFTAEVCAGEPHPHGVESLQVQWFPIDRLPDCLMGIHRLSLSDALSGGPAVVRSLDIFPTLSQLTRQELYRLRDEGKLDLAAFIAELCAPVEEYAVRDGILRTEPYFGG